MEWFVIKRIKKKCIVHIFEYDKYIKSFIPFIKTKTEIEEISNMKFIPKLPEMKEIKLYFDKDLELFKILLEKLNNENIFVNGKLSIIKIKIDNENKNIVLTKL